MKKILFTGGGSAGHVVPNVALIEELLSKGEVSVGYMGTDGIEKQIIAPWHIPFYTIECPKLVRSGGWKGLKNNLKIPTAFSRAVKQAEKGLREFQPNAVFSKGGYVALPVVVAAHRLKIPCFAHESDFSPGLANKLSARFCKKVFTSFPETAKKFRRGAYSGAPIKRSVLSASRAEAKLHFQIPFEQKTLLIFGGGSGSAIINNAVREQLQTLAKNRTILHVCGKGNVIDSDVKNYRQFEFISDMGGAYACADGIICRAGAGAVFEVLALKKPTIFIPLEGQTRGDQLENANYFQRKGLCRVLRQSRLSALSEEVNALFSDEELKKRLQESDFTSGNAVIINELEKTIQ